MRVPPGKAIWSLTSLNDSETDVSGHSAFGKIAQEVDVVGAPNERGFEYDPNSIKRIVCNIGPPHS